MTTTDKLEDLRSNYRYWQGFKTAVDEMSIGTPIDELMKLAYRKNKELEEEYVSAIEERSREVESKISVNREGENS